MKPAMTPILYATWQELSISITFQHGLNGKMLDISYCVVVQCMRVDQVQKTGIKIDFRWTGGSYGRR